MVNEYNYISRSNVISLLHFNNSITNDDITSNRWSITGNPQIVTTNAKFGKSLYLDGNSYLSSNLTLSFSGDFTIECWFNTYEAKSKLQHILGCNKAKYNGILCTYLVSNLVRFYVTKTDYIDTNKIVNSNTWYHYAVTRTSGVIRLFIDGVVQVSKSYSGKLTNTDCTYMIAGNTGTGLNPFYGMIREALVMNKSLYSGNFIPPDKPYKIQ